MKPPIAKKISKKLIAHNDQRIDPYYWLRDDKRKNKEVLKYLKDENKYSDHWFKENKVNSNEIFQDYKKALPKLEESYKTDIDGYKYFSIRYRMLYYRLFEPNVPPLAP